MRSTYLFFSVATPLALALVIPDESMLAEIVSESRSAVIEQDSLVSFHLKDIDMDLQWEMVKTNRQGSVVHNTS